jgi:hypothetical protein
VVEPAATAGAYFDGDTPDTASAEYGWAGARGASQSVLTAVAGPFNTLTEHRRNLATAPRAPAGAQGAAWLPNNSHWTHTLGTAVSDHPLGITTACAVTVTNAAGAGLHLASVYSIDGLGNSPTARGVGVWVKPPWEAQVTVDVGAGAYGNTVAPAGVWTYCPMTNRAGAGYAQVTVRKRNSQNVVAGDLTLITGCMAMAGALPGAYFDGDTPDTALAVYDWLGTPGLSASTERLWELTSTGLPPELTWDQAACLGPPINIGRWNDQPATLRWDGITPEATWDNYEVIGS